MSSSTDCYRCGAFLIEPAARRVLCEGHAIDLESKVFDLIELLLENRQRALGKQETIEAMWGQRPVTDAALSQLVYKARRVFHDDGEHQAFIRTVYGRGLQWVAPVEIVPAADAEVTSAPATESAGAGSHTHRRLWWAGIGLAVAVAVAVAAFAAVRYLVPPSAASTVDLPRVAVLPLANQTGDKSLAWTVDGLPGLVGSLLERHGDLVAVDQHTVTRAWGFTVPKGKTHAQHMRFVTGADILVQPTLRKLAANLYELTLQVAPGSGNPVPDIVLDGAKPAALAVQAVPRIRAALGLEPIHQPELRTQPHDVYLAETFARGMNALLHGSMADAKPYFALCARQDPSFLPCRLRLGETQARTNQVKQAGKTERAVLIDAKQSGNSEIAARALSNLAQQAMIRARSADALHALEQAAPLAKRSGDSALQVQIALNTAGAAADLKHVDRATSELVFARKLIAAHHLRRYQSSLYNAQSSVARARGDLAASEQADRASIAAATAMGDSFDAMANTYNLGSELLQAGKYTQALPLLFAARQRSKRLHNTQVWFYATNGTVIVLLHAGLVRRAQPLIAQMLTASKQQGIDSWRSWALGLRSSYRQLTGDAVGALADSRKVVALIDPRQDPHSAVIYRVETALLALPSDPGSLAATEKYVDQIVAAQPHPQRYAYQQQLVRALAAAADHNTKRAHAALKKAGTVPHPDDPQRADYRRAGLIIAMTNHDPVAAHIVLADFDPSRCRSALLLQLAARWVAVHGDQAMAKRITQRRATLKQAALQVLARSRAGTQPASSSSSPGGHVLDRVVRRR